MAPNSDWASPDLTLPGNWFSDSLIVADDGTFGSGCAPIQSNLAGKFVIVRRTECTLSEILVNIQVSGASAAIIVDSVSGRPLPFASDILSASISLPFVLISEHIGEALISDLSLGNDVVVSFGNKQNVHANDIGIYMERSWWSQYGSMDFESLNLPDSIWGTWVYNRGTNDVNNIQVTFSMLPKNDSTQYVEVNSPPFNLLSGDSVYVPLELYFRPTEGTFQQAGYVFYGYELSGFSDDDTLDNRIENYIWSENEVVSHVYLKPHPKWANMNALESDYRLYPPNFGTIENSHILRPAAWTNEYYALKSYVSDYEQPSGYCSIQYLDFNLMYDSSFYSPTEVWYTEAYDPWGNGVMNTSCVPLSWAVTTSEEAFKIAAKIYFEGARPNFVTDMYHDMRRQNDSTFQRYENVLSSGIDTLDIRLTTLSYHEFIIDLENAECLGGGIENSDSQVLIYPNPAKSVVTIESEEEIEAISIIDARGCIVLSQSDIDQATYKADISQLSEGVYTLIVQQNSGVSRQLLVVGE